MQQDGTAIVQARQAFSAYRSSLAGLSNHKDLVDAANNLTGGDKSTFFAVQESGAVTMDVARSLSAKVPGAEAGYSTALDAPGVLRSICTEVNQYFEVREDYARLQAERHDEPCSVSDRTGADDADRACRAAEFQQARLRRKGSDGLQFARLFQVPGGDRIVFDTVGRCVPGRYLGAIAQSRVGSALSDVTSDGTSLNTAFKMFGSFYYLTGAFATGVSGEEAASAGDPWSAGLDWGNSVGNVLLAANSSSKAITSALGNLGIDAGEDTAINGALDWAGPIGAGLSVLAQFGLAFHAGLEQKAAQNALQAQGQGFLEDGLHLKSGWHSSSPTCRTTSTKGRPASCLPMPANIMSNRNRCWTS